jgi:cytochrome c-type biogenesis protein CcmE
MVAVSDRKRLLGAVLIVAGTTAYLAYCASSSGWQYYLTVDECLAGGQDLVGTRVRVSGRIAAGSLEVDGQRTTAAFRLAGTDEAVCVRVRGPLPDGLAAEKDVMVEGRITEPGRLEGHKVLTRCASKYRVAETQPSVAE